MRIVYLLFNLHKDTMKNLLQFAVLLLLTAMYSCKGAQKSQITPLGENIGATISKANPISFDKLMDEMTKQDTVRTQLRAKVESVCLVKGCWMNLVPIAGESSKSVFVKFKDYGFFMPLDLAGQNVIVEGIAYKEITPVDELRHYAEDEGLSPDVIAMITEPEEELKFMADGVIILK